MVSRGTTFPHPPRYRSGPGSGKPRFAGIGALFFLGNQFSSFLWLRRVVREARRSASPGTVAFCFRRNHFSSFLLGRTGGQESQKIRLAGRLNFFSREPLSLIPSGRDGCSGPVDRRRREHRAVLRGEPLSLISCVSRDAIDSTPTISGGTPSSSWLQGGSEILAVRKTSASVLRLFPPTY